MLLHRCNSPVAAIGLALVCLGSLIPFLSAAEDPKEDSKPKNLAPGKAAGALDEAKTQLEHLDQSTKGGLLPAPSGLQVDSQLAPMPLSEKSRDPIPALLPQKGTNPKTKKQSKDWLLDGMQAQDPKSVRGGAQQGDDVDIQTQVLEEDEGLLSKPSRSASEVVNKSGMHSKKGHSVSKTDELSVTDPLRPFLSGWMTQSDYALLIKGMDKKSDSSRLTGLDEDTRDLGGQSSNLGLFLSRDGERSVRSRQDITQENENPFLKTLDSGSLTSASGAHPNSVPPLIPYQDKTNAQKLESNPSLRPITPAEELKERLKQDEDKKYFPQLKRF